MEHKLAKLLALLLAAALLTACMAGCEPRPTAREYGQSDEKHTGGHCPDGQ